MKNWLQRLTLWRVITAGIFACGLCATYLRFFHGWQPATNLSDAQPWGIWVGLAVLCGVALSAGGFAIATAVYLLGMDRYRPVAPAALLLAFLGYAVVGAGYVYSLGSPWRLDAVLRHGNSRSVWFDASLCILAYSLVLALQIALQFLKSAKPQASSHKLLASSSKPQAPRAEPQAPSSKLQTETPSRLQLVACSLGLNVWQRRLAIALALAGTLLASIHQSLLGGLFLVMKGRIYPLWYSPHLHSLFYLSAIPSGLCLLIMALHLSARALRTSLDYRILADLARVAVLMLGLYGMVRGVDLLTSGAYRYLFRARSETGYFWLEIVLLLVIPIALFSRKKVLESPELLYWAACVEIMGLMANRLNVSITAFEDTARANYVPKWPEMSVVVMLVAAAVLAYRFCVQRWNVAGAAS
jgi:Ni/Fe-hydrogenase subunit HybB-like protein